MSTPDNSADTYDAVIIGAGIVGTAVAFELARRGWRTLSVDKGPVAGYGSTSNSSSIVRFSYSTFAGVSVAWEGMHYWTDWESYLEAPDESGLITFEQCGMAILLTGDDEHADKVVRLWDQLGVPYEKWTKEELGGRMPILDLGAYGPPTRPDDDVFWEEAPTQLHGALFSPDGGYINDPQLACHNLQRAAEAKGGTFRFNAEVTEIKHAGNQCQGVTLADGTVIHAPVVVNVAGPHSSQVNRLAGPGGTMNIGTRSLRHETHHVAAPESFDFDADGFSISDDGNGIYFRPDAGNTLLVGNLDPACDEHEWVEPDDISQVLDHDQWEVQMLRANKRMPTLGMPHQKRGIASCYDVADDWIPIYDRTDLDGFYVAIGTSGNQFKNAGVAGHMMAELITAVEGGHDHDAEPLVVTGRYTGWDLEMATFQRNREVNPNSSMTVQG